jgi:LPXTG-site transpeptidase (sortase) family protein
LLLRALRITTTLTASALVVLTVPSLSARAGTAEVPAAVRPALVLAAQVRPGAFGLLPRHPMATQPPPASPAPVPAAARVAAPARVTPAAPVATFPMVAGEEAVLIIPSIGIRLPVVLGGQATIDRGLVTHYEASGWRPPVAAGAPGTYWLAAHHSTHGSPFAALPNVRTGAVIIIDVVGGGEIRYQVTGSQVVGTSASNLTVYGPDTTTPRILLQTCEGGAYRLLVHGVRTS